jgi:N-acetylneuraminic acid mutarotase
MVTGTLLAFFRPEAPAKVSNRTLTFEERVSYQRAIEEVYWRHRIWPKERRDPKPSLDAVMSQAQLEKKVQDYLRNSEALEDYWQRPLTAEQLQAEMSRMAQHTKQPDVLRELFEALGNDPFVIAECLARPALAERLLTSWYAHDQRIHGGLKQRAAAELQTHNTVEQMKQLSGKYSEIELVRGDSAGGQANCGPEHAMKLNSREWDESVQRLATMFGGANNGTARTSGRAVAAPVSPAKGAPMTHIKTGVVSPLQEDEDRYYATAVINKGKDCLKLATVEWRKEPLESWRARTANQVPTAMTAPNADYALPAISPGTGGCIDDTWTATPGPADSRVLHTAVWTGSEMIIWGGRVLDTPLNTGGRYSPSTDSWTATSTASAPTARLNHTAVWTGSEMIVWGGWDDSFFRFDTGGRYNPGTDSWTTTSTINGPAARAVHTAVWSGSEMIVWGGYSDSGSLTTNTGGRYNPGTDSWIATSTANAPDRRASHTAVLSGSEMIIWGGVDTNSNVLNTGGRYNPSTKTWTATSTTNAPSARYNHTAVWTGSEMIVWGGGENQLPSNTGGRYDPGTDSWTATTTANAPTARLNHTAVWAWAGSEMIVWGGSDDVTGSTNTGGRYSPGTDSWAATSTANASTARVSHTAVWTGSEMIVWGGLDGNGFELDTGGRYNPITDSWTNTGRGNAPTARYAHTAVWTGSEMVVWGGFSNTGGRYSPGTDSWAATSTADAPTARAFHTAVWTGSEMIVWGGGALYNTGGRYNPSTDSWTATSTNNAPLGRVYHTAVWSGSEMIIWGGVNSNVLNTGGRYNLSTDSWTATSTTNAPDARDEHTAVWTGREMIVWGGAPYDPFLPPFNTGGRYDPGRDRWTATSITNPCPTARSGHTAVWTDSEMIVWGGALMGFNTGGRYNPGTNSWTATSTTNAPSGRTAHKGVWTGSEMIVWGGFYYDGVNYVLVNTGGRYNPITDRWTATSITNRCPTARSGHTAVWTGGEMIVWGGLLSFGSTSSTGGRYCAQSGPTPTPTATPTPSGTPTATPRVTPTPRPRPTAPPRP